MYSRADSEDVTIYSLPLQWLVLEVLLPVHGYQTHDSLMLELLVLAMLVNFDTLFSCTYITVDTKEDSVSNVFSAYGGVVVYSLMEL